MEAMMAKYHELIVSASDAEVLALMLGERRRAPALETAAADALADLLVEARLVPHERLPADRIAMNSKVTYEEEPDGERRSVILVHPLESDPSAGRISVLSPVGLALLGRTPGSLVDVALPAGKAFTIRILDAARKRELRAA
jgi:regulator of nucleoside diphosphate kinase